ncbi:hydroxyisourate hydrolase [Nocardioides sp. Iso805N]|uniref:hydroxyisourate hydrolase n=1 Tax=Nocardioides sp. Iso805N TaxID=1283287 RepID=UPI00035DE509|nr:hydroxyisourate hydrolase [Nocardioides sp. Iso805N]
MSCTISAHVLDAERGRAASGMSLRLTLADGTTRSGTTDADGRVRVAAEVTAGVHTLSFATGPWFESQRRATFYPGIDVTFETEDDEHYHVALLLSPFAYTTYRGS